MKEQYKPNFLSKARWLFFITLFISTQVFGQANNNNGRVVKGIVTDEKNNPLAGVTIVEKGTTNSIATDAKGEFSISLEGVSNLLLFRMISYKDQEINVRGINKITVSMELAEKSLNEVVVLGYGTQKRSDLISAVSTLGKKDLESRQASSNPLLSMQGKVPGLQIYNNSGVPGGGDISFNIRGFSSLSGSNTPLILVDGVITNNLSGYSAADFETVTVLKDASSTAIYGARGSNGVILLTTKKAKSGVPTINYDGNVSIGTAARHIDMLDANGYMELFQRMWDYDPSRGDYNTVIKQRLHTDYPLLFDANNNPIYNTDWQKTTEQTAVSGHHYLSITQGNDKSRTGVYLGVNNERGLFRSDYQNKYTYRLNSEYNVNSFLTVGGELNGWNVNQQITSNLYVGGLNVPRTLIETPAILPVKFPNGAYSSYRDWGYSTAGTPQQYYSQGLNPFAQTNNAFSNSPQKLSDLRESVFATIKLIKGLEFKSVFTNENNAALNYFYDSAADVNGSLLGAADGAALRVSTWTSDNYFTFDRTYNSKHHFNAVLGAQWSASNTQTLGANSSGYNTDFYQYYNLGVGSLPPVVSSSYSAFQTNSYFGRLNYSYNNKYLATISSRYDGSSIFGANNKYALFPSAGLGWVVSQEDFFTRSHGLSNLFSYFKLRASYGFTGNSPAPYSSLGSVGAYTIDLNNQLVKGLGVGGAPNPDLKWEKTGQFDVGAEIRMLNDRISLTVDGYYKKTTNLLFNVPVTAVSGYTNITENIGSVRNQGIEIALTGEVIRSTDLDWSMTGLFAKNNNKVLALGTTNADVISGGFLGNSTILRVGQPMGSYIGFVRLGTWGANEAAEAAKYGKKPGDIKRLDVNHDYKFDSSDAVLLGSPFAKFDFTYSTSVRYKSWDLTLDIQVRYGSKIENVADLTVEDRTWYASGYASVLKDAWTPTHQNTMVPALRMAADPNNTDFGSYMDSHWLEDGSFVRGRSLNLGYRVLPAFANKIGFKNLRVYANLDNFFLITKVRVFDPESSSFGGGYNGQGQTFYDTPRPRTLTFGINANL